MSNMFYNRIYDRKIRHDQNTQVHTHRHTHTKEEVQQKINTQNTWSDLSWRKKVNISNDEEKLDKKEKEITLTEVMVAVKHKEIACSLLTWSLFNAAQPQSLGQF